MNEYPIPSNEQKIVKVTELRGSNLCEVQEPEGTKLLVSFPAKFKKLIWIKRGNFVL
jgi:probable RNA-binding protein EIF1AD